MNGITIMLIALIVLGAGYLLYGRWLAKTWGIDPKAKIPAYEMEDVIGQHIAMITQEGLTPYELWNTCFTPKALAAEALEAGLCLRQVYGDVAGAAYDAHSDTLAVVLEAK